MRSGVLAAVTLVLTLGVSSIASAQSPAVFECSLPGTVISSSAGTVIDTITVTDSVTIQDIQVSVDISHSFIGDMVIELASPAGTTVRLHNNDGLLADDLILTYGDGGGTYQAPYDCMCVLQPSGPGNFSFYELENSVGDWNLSITDDADMDDGVLNEWCLFVYTSSAPLPVTSLDCQASPAGDSVELNWVNNGAYDSIVVSRDGALIATLPGDATTFSDSVLPGLQTFCVEGILGTTPLGSACCTLSVVGDATGFAVIFVGETLGGMVQSAEEIQESLIVNGIQTILVNDLGGYTGTPHSLWMALGTFPANYVLGDDESFLVFEKLEQGVPVYIEGSDRFAVDPPTILNDYDGVDSSLSVDGDGTLLGLEGRDFAGASFAGLAAPYTEDSFGIDYNDKIVPATTDAAGPDAGVIWSDDGSGGAAVPYDVGIYYDTDAPYGDVISQSWEFGGYAGDRHALMSVMLEVLIPIPARGFRRGDANGDTGFDISDAIFLLAGFFTGGPAPTCQDSGDANDDGNLDIADAVFTLAALFTPMAPQPAAPGPDMCGVDPTMDVLDCATICP